jgi:hypothetical protein
VKDKKSNNLKEEKCISDQLACQVKCKTSSDLLLAYLAFILHFAIVDLVYSGLMGGVGDDSGKFLIIPTV